MKTLTFEEKYGDIRDDGVTIIQEQKDAEWPRRAREICLCVNHCRRLVSNGRLLSDDGLYETADGTVTQSLGHSL